MSLSVSELEDEALYLVDLLRPVRHGRVWLRPGAAVAIRGRIIKEEFSTDVGNIRPNTP